MVNCRPSKRRRTAVNAFIAFAIVELPLAVAQSWSSYSPVPRWGHAATYLGRPSTLLIHGGKTSSGYSYASAPNTADLLSLDLSSSFDLSAPPWRIAPVGTAPSTSFHSLSSLGEDVGSSSTQLLFGGDETGVALPSFNDSSWLLSVNTPFSAAATATWADQPASWATEPLRRIRHTATSITSGANSRTYVYGGLRSDGAGLAYGELWQMDAEAESVATSAIWRLVTTTGTAPPATYDHSATWLNGALIVIGGVSVAGSTSSMNDLGTIWRFSPTSNAAGEWTAIPVEGTVPAVRRGHAAIALDGGRILIHGGATLDEATAYDDMAILTVTGTSASWSRITATGSGPAGRWGHSAIYVANTVLYAFGYGAGAPADASLYAFDPTSSSWLTAFTIAVAIPSSISSTPTSTIASSAAASDTSSTPVWSVPGQPVQSAPPEATTDASAKEEPATTVPKIAVIIGSVVGTVALVALGGAAYIISRKRKRSSYRRDLHGLPSTGSDGVTIEKANPVRQPWRRFDMLEDEEMIWSGRRAGTDEYGFDEVEVRTPVSRGYDLGVGVPMSRREGSLMGEARRVVSDSASAVAASLGIGAAPAIRYSNVGRGEEEQQPLSPEASKRNMLSPAISLYGSTFSPLPGETPAAYNPLRRSGTWWTRFTANAGLARASPSQQRIRDPTPVPGSGDDPFQDPTWASSNPHSTDTTPKRSSYARHGRGEEDSDDEDDELLHPRREEGSMNSLASATSSLLEERIRTMDVVRRERPSEGSMTDVSPSTDDGAGPFADAERTPRFADEVVWRGTEVFSPSATTAIMSPTSMYAPTPPIPQSGVRSMVAEFERRKSLSESMAMQDTAMPPTGAMSPRTKARINHGLVKKPQLYVANPS